MWAIFMYREVMTSLYSVVIDGMHFIELAIVWKTNTCTLLKRGVESN